ncbi:MAG: thioredoxin family protein [Flammeovirgaceae bacterium]|nr:thioredoxin family protein [Flammeovirgaceae bacterium]
MKKAVFYHAGCPVCVSEEQEMLNLIDGNKVEVEIGHLGDVKSRLPEAENSGVKSVPALVLDNGHVLHINYGAGIADLK